MSNFNKKQIYFSLIIYFLNYYYTNSTKILISNDWKESREFIYLLENVEKIKEIIECKIINNEEEGEFNNCFFDKINNEGIIYFKLIKNGEEDEGGNNDNSLDLKLGNFFDLKLKNKEDDNLIDKEINNNENVILLNFNILNEQLNSVLPFMDKQVFIWGFLTGRGKGGAEDLTVLGCSKRVFTIELGVRLDSTGYVPIIPHFSYRESYYSQLFS